MAAATGTGVLMRAPRPGSRWSLDRVAHRRRYAAYMDSEAWRTRREQWHAHYLATRRRPPSCAVCGAPWSLVGDDLHHASYARLGRERDDDLIPMCRAHHTALHELWDTHPAWRRLGRTQATAGIIALLRRRHAETLRVEPARPGRRSGQQSATGTASGHG